MKNKYIIIFLTLIILIIAGGIAWPSLYKVKNEAVETPDAVAPALSENSPVCYSDEDQINPINCDDLSEMRAMEKYIRENIGLLATEETALGGTWYVVSVTIDPDTDTGHVAYEDGHIQSKADFSYTYDSSTGEMATNDFSATH
ncbi:MAG: hypothetical protein V4665_00260 [Patescibacteria group bacterium]